MGTMGVRVGGVGVGVGGVVVLGVGVGALLALVVCFCCVELVAAGCLVLLLFLPMIFV